MTSDDPNARRTRPFVAADATASDPWATLPFAGLPPPITEPVADWPPGLTRYRPLHALGSGGMGVVYLCHDTQLDRQVALKFPGLGRSAPQDRIDFALAEARAAARLHHPGICPLYDAAVCDGVPYLTMGFVQGPTLAAELKRLGPCPPQYAAKMLRAVAEAMQYAHDHGVIHRDLKPGNILLTAAHEPVVTDFGLAVRLDLDEPADGVITGTPHYMAPEQWAGDAAAIGERTDVFALGVILFEMFTGRVPFDGTAHQVRDKVLSEALPAVQAFRPDVPPELARIVAKATARNPADRFAGMAAFAEALDRVLRPPPKRSRGWVVWLVAASAAAVFGLLALGCLGLLLPAVQKVREPPAASTESDSDKRKRLDLLTEKGLHAMQEGWNDEALAAFDEASRLDPTNTTFINWRALVLGNANRPNDALAAWTESLRLDPTDGYVRHRRVDVLMGLKRYEEAIADLDMLLATADTGKAGLLIDRAEARYELRQYTAALSDLDTVLAEEKIDNFFGEAANAHYLRALTRKAVGDTAGAEADMQVAKQNAASLSGRSETRYKAGPWDAPPPTPPAPPPGK